MRWNKESARQVRHSVVFGEVTGALRSTWIAEIHASYRTLTSTGRTAFDAIRDVVADARATSSPKAPAPTT
jgi:hypothetical protein